MIIFDRYSFIYNYFGNKELSSFSRRIILIFFAYFFFFKYKMISHSWQNVGNCIILLGYINLKFTFKKSNTFTVRWRQIFSSVSWLDPQNCLGSRILFWIFLSQFFSFLWPGIWSVMSKCHHLNLCKRWMLFQKYITSNRQKQNYLNYSNDNLLLKTFSFKVLHNIKFFCLDYHCHLSLW